MYFSTILMFDFGVVLTVWYSVFHFIYHCGGGGPTIVGFTTTMQSVPITTKVSPVTKGDCHDIAELLLKVA